MFVSTSLVGMHGNISRNFQEFQLEKLRIQYDSNLNGIFRMRRDKFMHRLEID